MALTKKLGDFRCYWVLVDVDRDDMVLVELPTERSEKLSKEWGSSRLHGGEAMRPLMERIAL